MTKLPLIQHRLVLPKLTVLECDVLQSITETALAGGWEGERAIVARRALKKLTEARRDSRKPAK